MFAGKPELFGKLRVRNIDPPEPGIRLTVAEDVDELKPLPEPHAKFLHFLKRTPGESGQFFRTNSGPEFSHTTRHQIRVTIQFLRRQRR